MPFHRRVGTRLHPVLIRLLTGFRGTDSTNGFRAYKATIFEDFAIDIWQDWLDGTELEYYLHLQVIQRGAKITEVPVSKIYPQNVGYMHYTKVKPITDWWRILKPLVYCLFRVHR
jgi:dolichol-phosphate mannosyltransferase